MLPPGIGFNAISPRALEAAKKATLPRAFWSWEEIVAMNVDGLVLARVFSSVPRIGSSPTLTPPFLTSVQPQRAA